MKTKVSKKEKEPFKELEQKFMEEQNYAEQGFHLVDPKMDELEIRDENEIASTDSEESSDEVKKGE